MLKGHLHTILVYILVFHLVLFIVKIIIDKFLLHYLFNRKRILTIDYNIYQPIEVTDSEKKYKPPESDIFGSNFTSTNTSEYENLYNKSNIMYIILLQKAFETINIIQSLNFVVMSYT